MGYGASWEELVPRQPSSTVPSTQQAADRNVTCPLEDILHCQSGEKGLHAEDSHVPDV